MSLSNMQVFNDYYMPAISESLDQMLNAFNQASNGAIVLVNSANSGDFLLQSLYGSLQASRRRVDRYAAQAPVAGTNLASLANTAVKVAGGFGPVVFEPSQMTWLNKPTAEAIEVVSRQFAELIVQDQMNAAIAALVGALGQSATTMNDVSGGAKVTQTAINGSHALFGDMSQSLVATVINGAVYHQLVAANLANTPTLFQASNVRVVDILGKTVIVTDAPALTGATTYNALSLVQGAAVIRDPSNPIINIETSNGQTRIETSLQGDYDFTLGLKGYSWDVTNGGKSPTDVELALGTNWDKTATSVKGTAGVLARGDK